jgi:hypothetical protein
MTNFPTLLEMVEAGNRVAKFAFDAEFNRSNDEEAAKKEATEARESFVKTMERTFNNAR